ncbi:hypothetical protein FGO68_gene16818 [Halteria grandinella]|uniref:Uncharacterized protein n=1 Tax=Halteria grandinella TaxID=5974 RepID=A0A8J8T0K6_HALGN|nr:hypothetical protein FGO68_gene16818 [Halteria grandinella]
MRMTYGTETQKEILIICSCGSKSKCVYFCSEESCHLYKTQNLYCNYCEGNHAHGCRIIVKSCDTESKEHCAFASMLQDAQHALKPVSERYYGLVVILSGFAKTNKVQIKKDMAADFEKLATIESEANQLLEAQKYLYVNLQIHELLKLSPKRENLKKELLGLEYLVVLNDEMIYQNYEEVFKHPNVIPPASLKTPEDKDFVTTSKMRALQSYTSQAQVDLNSTIVEERKKSNDGVSSLRHQFLTFTLGQSSLKRNVETLTKTVTELIGSKQALEQSVKELEQKGMDQKIKEEAQQKKICELETTVQTLQRDISKLMLLQKYANASLESTLSDTHKSRQI